MSARYKISGNFNTTSKPRMRYYPEPSNFNCIHVVCSQARNDLRPCLFESPQFRPNSLPNSIASGLILCLGLHAVKSAAAAAERYRSVVLHHALVDVEPTTWANLLLMRCCSEQSQQLNFLRAAKKIREKGLSGYHFFEKYVEVSWIGKALSSLDKANVVKNVSKVQNLRKIQYCEEHML